MISSRIRHNLMRIGRREALQDLRRRGLNPQYSRVMGKVLR
jgi:hypothetical protein